MGALLLLKKITGGVPASAVGSLTGDHHQQSRYAIDRLVNGTQPAGAESTTGDVSQLQRYDHNRLFGGTAPPGAASATGDLGQIAKYLATNPARNLYLPNGFDIFGFYGWLNALSATSATDPRNALLFNNLVTSGFLYATVGGTGTFDGVNIANPISGRPSALRISTLANADTVNFYGVTANATVRPFVLPVTLMPNGYTKVELEFVVVVTATTGADLFVGWDAAATGVNHDTFGAGSNAIGVGFQSGDANWSMVGVAAGAVSKTSIAAVAANTAYQVKVSWDGTTLTGTVNGTSATKTTGLPTAANLNGGLPRFNQYGRSAATVRASFEWLIERMV